MADMLFEGDTKHQDNNNQEIYQNAQNSQECSINQYLQQLELLEIDQILNLFKKCNKSNFIKNILNQFINFLTEQGDEVIIESLTRQKDRDVVQIRKEFQNFIRSKKPNATMLISILKSKRFSVHFHYFLKYYSIDWIRSKRLKDIKNHLLCIHYLIRCQEKPELIECIIRYKKKD
ncbi:hypothetical protein TTHERM_00181050 (macronuclear) [Tetrahymena thermophila SB210]|uniref:Uncharacterized protein n=1 Tax=Tetrahymena thermophila (strain SB210) TaxID=312017 RepID=Q22TB1_TETTS|nr:hypothetical protein TTHERM_00181050 [Tetrahymena thermophila SB210]EAR88527.1 hypothetical protein TTHERM_00181050 [Tetrahymena thermophila SB210]|eukprot:XP_001008772.1 hypothetical protein TTHERM_00181050 [Tetrahymena thermophila SB210]